MQFKMWPLAAWNQIAVANWARALTPQKMRSNLGWIIVLSTIGGAMRMAVNDLPNLVCFIERICQSRDVLAP
jgi:hypothetical protein